jgi:hypothetical protein
MALQEGPRRMELQHVNVKLMLAHPDEIDLEPLVPIFHSWIQEQAPGDLLLDIADYRHVPAGPGVVLIGYQGDYSVDNARNRLGVRYNRKAELDGDNASRLRQAGVAALTACGRLESDGRLAGKFHFNGREVELFVNDRALAPNTDATRRAAETELRGFFGQMFGGAGFSMSFGDEPRRLFSVAVKTEQPFTVGQLLANLAS